MHGSCSATATGVWHSQASGSSSQNGLEGMNVTAAAIFTLVSSFARALSASPRFPYLCSRRALSASSRGLCPTDPALATIAREPENPVFVQFSCLSQPYTGDRERGSQAWRPSLSKREDTPHGFLELTEDIP